MNSEDDDKGSTRRTVPWSARDPNLMGTAGSTASNMRTFSRKIKRKKRLKVLTLFRDILWVCQKVLKELTLSIKKKLG